MKSIILKLVLSSFLAYFSGSVIAQEIHIDGVKFVHPIVEKWITEYKKENPDSKFNVKIDSEKKDGSSVLFIVASPVSEEEVGGNDKVVYVGRYALIPVSNKNNPLIEKVGKGLKKKELRNLIFEKDLLDDEAYEDDAKEKYTATIYSRNGQTPTTLTLAGHFSQSPERIRGKKIIGDEIYLLNAIQKDENGIAFNTLNYIYDLNTRQLKANLTILPLNLKSEQKEALLSQNIDQAISVLEDSKIETIPVEKFGLVIPEKYLKNAEVLKFANWILAHGQQYNHELGFLTLDVNTLTAQKKILKNDDGNLSYLSK
ncbi:MAG: substrate-binding domain-containing protein [Tannerella sp.]|jgi:ABC-type phosphate transport system substrate-binding protein|nr:substrate-binding domain-containing protein [Tannerella sp.]